MKIYESNESLRFTPIQLNLIIETEEEARSIYAIFNRAPNKTLFGEQNTNNLLKIIGKKYYVSKGEIANGISYETYYEKNQN